MDGSDVNTADRSPSGKLLAVGDDFGKVKKTGDKWYLRNNFFVSCCKKDSHQGFPISVLNISHIDLSLLLYKSKFVPVYFKEKESMIKNDCRVVRKQLLVLARFTNGHKINLLFVNFANNMCKLCFSTFLSWFFFFLSFFYSASIHSLPLAFSYAFVTFPNL